MVMKQYKMMSFVFCCYRLPVKYNLNGIAPIIIFISFVYFYFSKSVQMKKIWRIISKRVDFVYFFFHQSMS